MVAMYDRCISRVQYNLYIGTKAPNVCGANDIHSYTLHIFAYHFM